MPKRTAKKSAKKPSARAAKNKAGKATKKATRKATKKAPRKATKKAPSKVAKKPAARKARRASAAAGSRSSTKKAAAGSSRRGENRLMQLRQLIELMVDRDVVEVELEEAGARWRVRRTEPQAVSFAAAPSIPIAAAPAVAAPAPVESAPAVESEVYTSPMLGTFYHAPSPDAEAFVKPGDRVTPDTTLCIIEAMKVMNEIKAERDFEVVEMLVKNGEPVEFGQPLFLIK